MYEYLLDISDGVHEHGRVEGGQLLLIMAVDSNRCTAM